MGDWSVVPDAPAGAGAGAGAVPSSAVAQAVAQSDWAVVPDAEEQQRQAGRDLSGPETFALHAGNLFGAGPAIQGALHSVIQGGSYTEWRDAYKRMLEGSEQNDHNVARIAGKGGSMVLETALGGAAGKAIGGATKISAAVGKIASPITRGLVEGGIAGAGYGALGGAGEALSSGDSVAAGATRGAAGGAVGGAVLGGVVAPALGAIGGKLREKYTQTFGAEVLGMARPRDKAAWAGILGKEAESGVEKDAARTFIASKEMHPVEEAARKHRYDDALSAVETNLERLRPGREANYAALDEAGQKFQVGKGLDNIERAEFSARNAVKKNPLEAEALAKARDIWVRDYSTVEAGALQRTLLRPEGLDVTPALADELRAVVDVLPQSGAITRTLINDAIEKTGAGPDALRYITSHVLDGKQGLLSWNPAATIPSVELRAAASNTQEAANQALGTLMQTANAQKSRAVSKAVVGALEEHLDAVAKADPKLSAVVDKIRQDDVKFSVLLAAKTGLSQATGKTNVNELGLGKSLGHVLNVAGSPFIAAPMAATNAQESYQDFSEGHIAGGLKHGAEALLFGSLAGRGAVRTLSRYHNRLAPIEAAAASGNGRAIAVLKALAQRASAQAGQAFMSSAPPAGTVSDGGI